MYSSNQTTRCVDASVNRSVRRIWSPILATDPWSTRLAPAARAKIVDLCCAISVAHRRAGGDHSNTIDAAQGGNQGFGKAIRKERLSRVSGAVFQRQNGQRGLLLIGVSGHCAL